MHDSPKRGLGVVGAKFLVIRLLINETRINIFISTNFFFEVEIQTHFYVIPSFSWFDISLTIMWIDIVLCYENILIND